VNRLLFSGPFYFLVEKGLGKWEKAPLEEKRSCREEAPPRNTCGWERKGPLKKKMG